MRPTHPEKESSVVNVASRLKRVAEKTPYKRAVVYPFGRDNYGRVTYSHLTFLQLDRESDCLAHGMHNAGITRGTRTILMVKPSLEFFIIIFSLFKTGAIPVVVDPGMGIRRMVALLQRGSSGGVYRRPRRPCASNTLSQIFQNTQNMGNGWQALVLERVYPSPAAPDALDALFHGPNPKGRYRRHTLYHRQHRSCKGCGIHPRKLRRTAGSYKVPFEDIFG